MQTLDHNFASALALMEAAILDCPDQLWRVDLWPQEAPTSPGPHGGLHGSAPWFLAYHALSCLDYDLTGGFGTWEPPEPFDETTFSFPNRVFAQSELEAYVSWCRRRVGETLETLTEETALLPLSGAHRMEGMQFGVLLGSIPLHVVEHASQVRQFLTAAAITVRPMPGDRGYG